MRHILTELNYTNITIRKKDNSEEIIKGWKFGTGTENIIFSAYIKATKPDQN